MSPNQKGFLPRTSGCLEHQAILEQAIRSTRNGQDGRSLVFVQTDLTDAYGSTRHRLLHESIAFYKFPQWFRELIQSMYERVVYLIRNGDSFLEASVKCGLITGDPLSTILFNVVYNFVLEPLEKEEMKRHGAAIGLGRSKRRVHHLTFADDHSQLTRSVESARAMFRVWLKCIEWSRCFRENRDKGSILGLRKERSRGTVSFKAFYPEIVEEGEQIPFAGKEDVVRFLGRFYSTDLLEGMECCPKLDKHLLETELRPKLRKLDEIEADGKVKLAIFKLGFVPFTRWVFTVQNIDKSWLNRTGFRQEVISYLKKWARMGVRSSVETLFLPAGNGGLGLTDPEQLAMECQLSRHGILSCSRDEDVRRVWQKMGDQEVKSLQTEMEEQLRTKPGSTFDQIPSGYQKRQAISQEWRKQYQYRLRQAIRRKPKNGAYLRSSQKPPDRVRQEEFRMQDDTIAFEDLEATDDWLISGAINNINSDGLLSFAVRAAQDILPSPANLRRWYSGTSPSSRFACRLCDKENTTLGHILCSCPFALNPPRNDLINRIKFRHNRVLRSINEGLARWLSHLEGLWRVSVDLPGSENHYQQFPLQGIESNFRPDVVAINDQQKIIVLGELTCPMESEMWKWFEEKKRKYEVGLQPYINEAYPDYDVRIRPFEVGARGRITESLTWFLREFGTNKAATKKIRQRAAQESLAASYAIWVNRNYKEWRKGDP